MLNYFEKMEVGYKETNFVIFLLLLAIGLQESAAIKKVEVKFPSTARPGDNVLLQCFFDLENEVLYNVKWYKSQEEFFRYTESEKPKIKLFRVRGVQVQKNISSLREVELIHVSTETDGNYTCEVNTEGPLFTTLSASQKLNIVDNELPVNIVVPKKIDLFNSTKISCTYNFSNTWVKYVKLLKDGREFYKYVFGDEVKLETKKLPGVALSAKQTKNSTEIKLNEITSDTEGVYKCEVGVNNTIFEESDYLFIAKYSPKRVHLEIPKLVRKGSDVTLKCQFHADKQILASVSWYKGNRLFYTYKTVNNECDVSTLLPGVNPKSIYRSQDDRTSYSVLLLKNVSSETGGKYRCEVLMPWGEKYSNSETLYVIHYPSGEPTIFVDNDFLSYRDRLHAECASAPSYPPANITWLWNGNKITDFTYDRIENKNGHSVVNGFPVPSTSSLVLTMDYDIFESFHEGKAKLSCVVTIADDYRKEKSVILEKSNPVYRLEEASSKSVGAKQFKVSSSLVAITSILFLLRW